MVPEWIPVRLAHIVPVPSPHKNILPFPFYENFLGLSKRILWYGKWRGAHFSNTLWDPWADNGPVWGRGLQHQYIRQVAANCLTILEMVVDDRHCPHPLIPLVRRCRRHHVDPRCHGIHWILPGLLLWWWCIYLLPQWDCVSLDNIHMFFTESWVSQRGDI